LQPTQQLSSDPQRLRVVLEPPANLLPGRVAISLILKYRCGDQTVFDETEPIAFRLLERPTP
jgi:hypothetical protein